MQRQAKRSALAASISKLFGMTTAISPSPVCFWTAALFSTISFLGLPGEIITYGPGLMWMHAHTPITYLVVAFLVIPRIMKYRITSGYELLESRFGSAVRKTASLLFIFVRLLPAISIFEMRELLEATETEKELEAEAEREAEKGEGHGR